MEHIQARLGETDPAPTLPRCPRNAQRSLGSQWKQGKKAKVAHLGDESNMYYHPEVGIQPAACFDRTATKPTPAPQMKRWVERGREEEVLNEPGNTPPPSGPSVPAMRLEATSLNGEKKER